MLLTHKELTPEDLFRTVALSERHLATLVGATSSGPAVALVGLSRP
jgi:hypothetical protein